MKKFTVEQIASVLKQKEVAKLRCVEWNLRNRHTPAEGEVSQARSGSGYLGQAFRNETRG